MSFFDNGFSTERKTTGMKREFFGKYRAIVTNVMDSDTANGRMGRVKVSCPKVLGDDESDWCTPCMPFAGPNKGIQFMPKVGDTVWVEFEEGDPDRPIWTGNWWAPGERPGPINESYDKGEVGLHHVIETEKVKFHFNDKDEFLYLKVNGVTMKWDGKNNTVEINSPKSVTVKAASSISLDAPSVSVGGNLSVSGNVSASGRVSGSNIG